MPKYRKIIVPCLFMVMLFNVSLAWAYPPDERTFQLKKDGSSSKTSKVSVEVNVWNRDQILLQFPEITNAIVIRGAKFTVMDWDFMGKYPTLMLQYIGTEDTLNSIEEIGEEHYIGIPKPINNLQIIVLGNTTFYDAKGDPTPTIELQFTAIHPGTSPNIPKADHITPRSLCAQPQAIDQDVWRVGLPLPKNEVTRNDPRTLIVHHTFTPNTDSDYVAIVRSIYIYHTEVNGWDDIGYNYLVAPDGTLFAGRDGRGIVKDKDAQGAHFCGKNAGKLGVALIGDFSDSVSPTDTAIGTLVELLAWAANQESINVLDSFGETPRLAGHRNGCATECPGDRLYAKLGSIRKRVDDKMRFCGQIADIDHSDPQDVGAQSSSQLVYNGSTPYLLFNRDMEQSLFSMYDISGKLIQGGTIPPLLSKTTWTIPSPGVRGVYLLSLQGMNGAAPSTFKVIW